MGAAKPDVVVRVRRRVVRIQGKYPGIRAIVIVAAADKGRRHWPLLLFGHMKGSP